VSPDIEHEIRLEQWGIDAHQRGSAAQCSCGWHGSMQFSAGAATRDGQEHLKQVGEVRSRLPWRRPRAAPR
jgi:hypothetical protein